MAIIWDCVPDAISYGERIVARSTAQASSKPGKLRGRLLVRTTSPRQLAMVAPVALCSNVRGGPLGTRCAFLRISLAIVPVFTHFLQV